MKTCAAALVRLDRLDEARTTMARLIELDPMYSLSGERETAQFGDSPLMNRYLADLEATGAPAAAGQVRAPAADSASISGQSIPSGVALQRATHGVIPGGAERRRAARRPHRAPRCR